MSSANLDFVVNSVCETCNNGWMSQIESNAIPFVKPMIEGQAIKHGEAAQDIVSTWLALRTLMAFSTTKRSWPPVMWHSFDWVYANRSIPPNWHVWLAKYHGSMPAHYETQAFQSIGGQPTPVPGIMMTSVLGYLAYKIVGLSGSMRLNYRANVLVRIAPHV